MIISTSTDVFATTSYKIIYEANGGAGAPPYQIKNHGKTLKLSSKKPTRTGHSFLGWSTNSKATSASYSAGGNYTANKAIRLYAVWRKNTYSVRYNANGGSGTPTSQTKTYGTTLKLSGTRPTRSGHVFLGWSTNSKATSASYSAGGNYTSNAAATLYAIWRKSATYTIKYNANGGSGAPGNQTKTEGITLVLSSTTPKRTGYTFSGWATSSKATSSTYSAKGNYTANKATTLYAVWKRNTYAINYSANGGSGAPGNQTKTYGTTLKLSNTKPTRRGYVFLGWATSSSATKTSYSAGGNYTGNAKLTLYAVWKAQGGTWTSGTGYSSTSHIYKKVYMPKDVATEYYMVLSDQTLFGWIKDLVIDIGLPAAAGVIAVKLGVSSGVAGAAATTALTLQKYSKFMNENNLKNTIKNCPQNGFVVIEYWQIKNSLTGQLFPTIMHKNTTEVNSGGSFRAGVYFTN